MVPRIVLIAGRDTTPDVPGAVARALGDLPHGAACVQVREKDRPARDVSALCAELLPLCRATRTPLLINDRADVALALGLDGVHLPGGGLSPRDARALLGPEALISVAAHSDDEVRAASAGGADLALFAPVFETPGKGPAQGLGPLARAARAAPLPVFALGGVTPENARACLEAGAAGVAVIRSLVRARELWSAIALALLLSALPARADDSRYQDYAVGSRALALGGAFVALGDDPSGLTYNPAGICDARKLNVSVSASLYGFEKQSSGGAGLVGRDTFSLASLATLNVIPGEAGTTKGFGEQDARGTPWALGFEIAVPSYRAFTSDKTSPNRVHTSVLDRTFDVAFGGGMRVTPILNLGLALHYVLRQFTQDEASLAKEGDVDPKVVSYQSATTFQNGNLVPTLGAKLRLDDGKLLLGASVGLPSFRIHSSGHVSIQDLIADPRAPAGEQVQLHVVDSSDVSSETPTPFHVRAGAALIGPGRYTISGQLTVHAPTSYERLTIDSGFQARLRLQTHVDRGAVVDLNLGGEYLLSREWSVAAGLHTSNTGAPALRVLSTNALDPGSSRLPRVSLVGGSLTLGQIGNHSISRIGVTVSYGSGEQAVPNDPSGIFDPVGYTRGEVKQLFLYVFLASTFRY